MELWKKYKKAGWDPFETYLVSIHVKNIAGGKPATPDIIQKWVDATNKQKSQEERIRIAKAHVESLPDITDEKHEKQSNIFSRKDGQLCIEGRQIKAMLKESANIIKNITPTGPITALRSKVADQVFVDEEYIPIGKTEPDKVIERPIHVMTAQGPRTSIKRMEIVENVDVVFTVRKKIGRDKMSVPEATLLAILDYAQTIGLGADRSQGYGTFEVTSVAKIENNREVENQKYKSKSRSKVK